MSKGSGHACERCQRRFETSRGLGLHLAQHHPGTVQLITCGACGIRCRLWANGMCRPCCDKARHAPRICSDCGELRRHQSSGRCARCHRRAAITTAATCSECLAWGAVVGGRCFACRQFRRTNDPGVCAMCRREVPIGRDSRCRLCSITRHASGSNEGLCCDCDLWAPLIAGGRCNTCVMFRFRCEVGVCNACSREVIVGKLGRCRRCLVTAARDGVRYPGRPMDSDRFQPVRAPTPPGSEIQLFFAGMRSAGRRSRVNVALTGHELGPETQSKHSRQHVVPGQLRLLWIPADLSKIDVDEILSTAVVELPDLFASVATFGEARGWSERIVRGVQRATAVLLAARCDGFRFDPGALGHLLALDLPVEHTLDFVADAAVMAVDPGATMDAWLEDRLRRLPEQIRNEVRSWTEVLRGRSKRRAKPRLPNTVKAYVRACGAALEQWATRYDSLREVTSEDVQEQLLGLAGWDRPNALNGMRSLFRTLKANRLIFADPTAHLALQAPAPRPSLGVDPATRGSLLDQIARLDHRLIVLLAGVHALSGPRIANLRLDHLDLPGKRFFIDERPRPLDELTREHLMAWLNFRHKRWPQTANPHVLVTSRSANRVAPVGQTYVNGAFADLPVTASGLRVDRLVSEAMDSRGDALRIALLFGMSAQAAAGYAVSFSRFDDQPVDEFAQLSPRFEGREADHP